MQYILGLIPLVGWGSGDIFGAYASRKIGAYNATFYAFFFAIVMATFALPFFVDDLHKLTLPLVLANLGLGQFYTLGNFFVNEGFKEANAAIVGIIMQSFPALVLIASHLIFDDPITGTQVLWIIVVFVGVIFLSLDFKELRQQELKFNRGVKFGLTAALMFAAYFTFFRVFADQYGWFLPNYISFLTLPVALMLSRLFIHEENRLVLIRDPKIFLFTFMAAFLLRSGDMAMNIGITEGYTVVVTTMAAAAPVLFVVLSAIVFKDKISRQQAVGVIITLVGLVGLTVLA